MAFHYCYVHAVMVESPKVEKAFKIMKSNYQPDLRSPNAKSCPVVPHPHILKYLQR